MYRIIAQNHTPWKNCNMHHPSTISISFPKIRPSVRVGRWFLRFQWLSQRLSTIFVKHRLSLSRLSHPRRLQYVRITSTCKQNINFCLSIVVIEIIQLVPNSVKGLTTYVQNGKINLHGEDEKSMQEMTYHDDGSLEIYCETTQPTDVILQDVIFPVSVWEQFKILICRMALQMSRNKTMLYIQFFHHLLSGLLIAGIFMDTGNDASRTISVFKYCICINVFFMYTHVMAPVLLCNNYKFLLSLLLKVKNF